MKSDITVEQRKKSISVTIIQKLRLLTVTYGIGHRPNLSGVHQTQK